MRIVLALTEHSPDISQGVDEGRGQDLEQGAGDQGLCLDSHVFDLRPKGAIKMLDLLRPIYRKTWTYGHFGREEPELTWEKTDTVDDLLREAGPAAA
ncbi:methionine adenosyltransferase domain-containing protein [Mesorhizobium erdmanii]|uniref:methionine adenosyltransferase domain-containing protein n=1 Tax=Mesorhizobium erdmanii TaxID=1777866 RepID=UPI00047E3B8A|nr:methionine adenosyltransferase domain-containing protein [Mesorhizobium erdmanii]